MGESWAGRLTLTGDAVHTSIAFAYLRKSRRAEVDLVQFAMRGHAREMDRTGKEDHGKGGIAKGPREGGEPRYALGRAAFVGANECH